MKALIMAIALAGIPSIWLMPYWTSTVLPDGSCAPEHWTATALVYRVRQVVTSTGPEEVQIREAYQLPLADSADVSLVAVDSICVLAVAAYNQWANTPGAQRTVQVVRVADRYIVTDPSGDAEGEWRSYVVFTEDFSQHLAAWGG